MREALLWVHRWLGLTAGLVFAIAAGTGAVIVYQPELDVLLGGPRWGATEGTQTPAEIESTVLGASPDATIAVVRWPTTEENAVRVEMRSDDQTSILWVDNGSGRLLEPRQTLLILRAIRRLHVDLLLRRPGRLIVIWATWAALLSLALGAYLWWPGIRKFWTGFRIRLRRGTYILNFDLHQSLGILALPLLVLGCATGVMMAWPGNAALVRVSNAVYGGPPPEYGLGEVRSTPPPAGSEVSSPDLTTLVGWVRAEEPDAYLEVLRVPAERDGAVTADLTSTSGARIRMALDQYSGSVLNKTRQEPDFRFGPPVNEQLHSARIGGPVFKLLYMISCALGAVMLPTGVIMWWIKRTRKAESAGRRAGTTTAQAADGS